MRWGDEPPTLTLEQMFAAAALLLAERLEAFEFATPPEAKEACVGRDCWDEVFDVLDLSVTRNETSPTQRRSRRQRCTRA